MYYNTHMKNAILLHGTSCTPEDFWQPSIAAFLRNQGYNVWAPQLPDADVPDLKKWLPMVLAEGTFTTDTVLIGHSAGSPFALSILENIDVQIHKAVLVAGYARPKGKELEAEPILQKEYDWKKIKSAVRDLVFINSDNDPWGCDAEEGLYMWRKLGGTLIVREGEGHMGSNSYGQPYSTFPLLEKILELKYTRSVIDGSDKH